jgi:hypothetical protein
MPKRARCCACACERGRGSGWCCHASRLSSPTTPAPIAVILEVAQPCQGPSTSFPVAAQAYHGQALVIDAIVQGERLGASNLWHT